MLAAVNISPATAIEFEDDKIAKAAYKNGTTLKEEVLKTNLISKKEYEKIMDPIKMTKPE